MKILLKENWAMPNIQISFTASRGGTNNIFDFFFQLVWSVNDSVQFI